jgi:hypothetical protein
MTGLWRTEKVKQINTMDIPSLSLTAHEPPAEFITLKRKDYSRRKIYKIQSLLHFMASI